MKNLNTIFGSLEKPRTKLLRKLKRTRKVLKLILHMEAKHALLLVLSHLHFQLKIRPRLRVIAKIVVVLVLLYFASDKALAYIKPKEAEIKINGQAIMVAQQSTAEGQNVDAVEINQAVGMKASPFNFSRPVEGGYISQGFSGYHPGNDIAVPLGSPIHSVGDGRVIFAGFTPDGRGNEVLIDHGDGLVTLYAHMGKIYAGAGNRVNSDTILGTVGLTGHTTGPHVHFEVHDHDVPVDPQDILPQ